MKKHKVMAAAANASSVAVVLEPEVETPTLPVLADAEIAARAYSYWEGRGFQGGSPEEDWQRAIEALEAERRR